MSIRFDERVVASTAEAAPPPTAAMPGDGGVAGSPAQNLSTLEAVRAVAALAVVAIHVHQVFFLFGTYVRWARAGDVGVTIFFVLSGYLIASSVLRPATFATGRYMLRRAARIVPLYYLSILIGVVLVDATPLLSRDGIADIGMHVILLHGLARGMRFSINGVLWTLCVEWLFYLFMAVVGRLFRRPAAGWVIAGCMLALGPAWRLFFFETAEGEDLLYAVQQLPGMADLFGAGMLCALLARRGWWVFGLRRRGVRRAVAAVSTVWVVAMLALYDRSHSAPQAADYWHSGPMMVLWPLAFGLGMLGLIVTLEQYEARLRPLMVWSGLAYLGRISFGIYLLHPFVAGALADAWFASGPDVPVLPFFVLTVGGTALLSAAFHHTIERPAMDWVSRRTRTVSAAGGGSLPG